MPGPPGTPQAPSQTGCGKPKNEGAANDNAQVRALVELHTGLARQGPGDAAFTKHILSCLPELPKAPFIMDLGCGTGAGTLLLAEWFNTRVIAVDMARPFLETLEAHARAAQLDHLVRTLACDMGNIAGFDGSVDLLWSEGAAYCLTFQGALAAWRPLLSAGGVAVISEMSWFTRAVPQPPLAFWRKAYPEMADEAENRKRAEAAGFRVLGLHRLPARAWWDNYYRPLQDRISALRPSAGPVMQEVIAETELEMALFRSCSDVYGYTFYILKAR